MRFYHDSGLAFSKATAGRKDHADPAPPPPSADLWVWRLHKGRLQWLFFGLSAHIIIVIVQWTFIFHFGACCFLALMCYIVNENNYLQPRHQVHRDGAFGWRSPYRDQEAPLGSLAAGDVGEIPEADHVRPDALAQQAADTPGHKTR